MDTTTHCDGVSPINPADYFGKAASRAAKLEAAASTEDFGKWATEQTARAKAEAASAAVPLPELKENVGEMVARLVEENRPRGKTVTATQYKQATKF
jgi:hypothetical protein